jgi:hypothetical protein
MSFFVTLFLRFLLAGLLFFLGAEAAAAAAGRLTFLIAEPAAEVGDTLMALLIMFVTSPSCVVVIAVVDAMISCSLVLVLQQRGDDECDEKNEMRIVCLFCFWAWYIILRRGSYLDAVEES